MLLVVEDEPDLAALIRMIFDPGRFAVVVADDLASARSILARPLAPDLVILNVVLPDGDGLDLCRGLRAAGMALPVIVLTGMVGTRAQALAAGADAFVTKPFDPDALAAEVERLLRGSRGGP